MVDIEKTGRQPDFKGDGVAVWVNQTKEKKQYLSINLLQGNIKVAAWKNELESPQTSSEKPQESTADEVIVTQEKSTS